MELTAASFGDVDSSCSGRELEAVSDCTQGTGLRLLCSSSLFFLALTSGV